MIKGQPKIVNFLHIKKFFDFGVLPDVNVNNFYSPGKEYNLLYSEFHLIKDFGKKIDPSEFGYKFNGSGLRCDELDPKSRPPPFIYGGCSFSFGAGLPYKTSWPGLLHQNISPSENFINIAYNGGSIEYILRNIYNYLAEAKGVQSAFVLLPDFNRKNFLINGEEYIFINIENHESFDFLWASKKDQVDHQMYHIKHFLSLCKKDNIRVLWSTWGAEHDYLESQRLEGFVSMKEKDIFKNCDQKNKFDNKYKKYYYSARDGAHPGIAYQSGVANIFFRELIGYDQNH